jgi:hypothetical protein
LEFTTQSVAHPPPPSSSSVPLLCCATAPLLSAVATPPEANYSSSAAPRVTPELAAALAPLCWLSPNTPRRSAVRLSCPLSVAADRRRSPSLQSYRRHLLLWLLPCATSRLAAVLAPPLWPSSARATPPCLCPSSAGCHVAPSIASSSYRSPCLFLILQHDQELPFDYLYPLARPSFAFLDFFSTGSPPPELCPAAMPRR